MGRAPRTSTRTEDRRSLDCGTFAATLNRARTRPSEAAIGLLVILLLWGLIPLISADGAAADATKSTPARGRNAPVVALRAEGSNNGLSVSAGTTPHPIRSIPKEPLGTGQLAAPSPQSGPLGPESGSLGPTCLKKIHGVCVEVPAPLIYQGGTIQYSPAMYLIFWGANWTTTEEGVRWRGHVLNTLGGLTTEYGFNLTYEHILNQYCERNPHCIENPTIAATYIYENVNAPQGVRYRTIEEEVEYAIAQNHWPRGPNNQFIVLHPPESAYQESFVKEEELRPDGTKIEVGCGFHERDIQGDVFAFLPDYANKDFERECGGAAEGSEGETLYNRILTTFSTHEYAEAATDPGLNGTGWIDSEGHEIGDMCGGYGAVPVNETLGIFVNGLWGNREGECIFKDPPEPIPPAPAATTGAASNVSAGTATLNGTVNPNGPPETYYYFEYGTTTAYGADAPTPPGTDVGFGEVAVPASTTIGGLQPGTTYHYRIVALSWAGTSYGEDRSITTSGVVYASKFGSVGSGNGQFQEPKGVALDLKGNIWVVDPYLHRVQEFNEKEEYVRQFGTLGTGNGQFKEPKGIAADSKGNIWVSDEANNSLQEFNEKGEFVRKVGTFGSGNGQFSAPQGIAVDSKNNVWVADSANNRVQELNEKGEYVSKFGTSGSGNGQFNTPNAVAVDLHSNVWVADTQNNRVQEFTSAGAYVSQFGSEGTGNGQFKEPKGLTTDSAGNVWVEDTEHSRVEEFTAAGEYMTQFGSEGNGTGQFNKPRGIAINAKGAIWISDTANIRIDKWLVG
jgi:streptogramin lyase